MRAQLLLASIIAIGAIYYTRCQVLQMHAAHEQAVAEAHDAWARLPFT